MKIAKIALAAAVVAGLGMGSARADNVGCGLGSVVFSGQRGLVFDLGATFLNNVVFYNQAFGMSTGTLGCKQNARIERRQLFAFMQTDGDKFAMEAATGTVGESMTAAAEILDVDANKLAQITNEHFEEIFGANSDSSTATNKIYDLIGESDCVFVKPHFGAFFLRKIMIQLTVRNFLLERNYAQIILRAYRWYRQYFCGKRGGNIL
jgi:hypothetical protein